MIDETTSTLPLIDIYPFLATSSPDKEAKERCAKEIYAACCSVGFFYLVNHGIPISLTDSILSLGRDFFLLSSAEEKAAIMRQKVGVGHGDGARGWQPLRDNMTKGMGDWQEAVDFYREHDEEEHGSTNGPPYDILKGKNIWPQRPENLKESFEDYVAQMSQLGDAVLRAMGAALKEGDEDIFVQSTNRSFWGMRLIGYAPIPEVAHRPGNHLPVEESDDDGISCGEHTDYGCVTLLLTDSTKGALQVRPQCSTDFWVNADPVPGAFIVNIGDMMERWTNGLWRSTPHRVVHRGPGFRVACRTSTNQISTHVSSLWRCASSAPVASRSTVKLPTASISCQKSSRIFVVVLASFLRVYDCARGRYESIIFSLHEHSIDVVEIENLELEAKLEGGRG